MGKTRKKEDKRHRHFTESVRKSIVKEIEKGLKKSEACRKYGITNTTIYRWMEKYSSTYQKRKRTIVGLKSEASKYKELEKELKQVYELLGRSQTEVLYLKKLLELASDDLEIDLKKNIDMSLLDISTNLKKKR